MKAKTHSQLSLLPNSFLAEAAVALGCKLGKDRSANLTMLDERFEARKGSLKLSGSGRMPFPKLKESGWTVLYFHSLFHLRQDLIAERKAFPDWATVIVPYGETSECRSHIQIEIVIKGLRLSPGNLIVTDAGLLTISPESNGPLVGNMASPGVLHMSEGSVIVGQNLCGIAVTCDEFESGVSSQVRSDQSDLWKGALDTRLPEISTSFGGDALKFANAPQQTTDGPTIWTMSAPDQIVRHIQTELTAGIGQPDHNPAETVTGTPGADGNVLGWVPGGAGQTISRFLDPGLDGGKGQPGTPGRDSNCIEFTVRKEWRGQGQLLIWGHGGNGGSGGIGGKGAVVNGGKGGDVALNGPAPFGQVGLPMLGIGGNAVPGAHGDGGDGGAGGAGADVKVQVASVSPPVQHHPRLWIVTDGGSGGSGGPIETGHGLPLSRKGGNGLYFFPSLPRGQQGGAFTSTNQIGSRGTNGQPGNSGVIDVTVAGSSVPVSTSTVRFAL